MTKGDDWSQDAYTIAHNGVLVLETQFNPVKSHRHVYILVQYHFFSEANSDYCNFGAYIVLAQF